MFRGIEYWRTIERGPYPGDDGEGLFWPERASPPSGLMPMQQVDVFEFIDFGVVVQTTRWFAAHSGVDGYDWAKIRGGQLKHFRDRWLAERKVGLDLIDYAISELDLACTREDLRRTLETLPEGDRGSLREDPVDWNSVARSVSKYLNDLMTLLQYECAKFPVFVVSQARAFDTSILMSEAERALSASAQKRLSLHNLEGWREAGRCLAFDAPTAAAFQTLRVTEGFIKRYRVAVTGQEAGDEDTLAEHINALKKSSVRESVITAMRSLKNAHRNPTMHPGKNVTADEAVSLFGLCTSVIDFISADMDSRELAKGSGNAVAST